MMGKSLTLYPRKLNYWMLPSSRCVTLVVNNNISTAAVFSNIKEAFDATSHSGSLSIFSELEFSYKSH
jgi:hypothetical protein